LTFKKNCKLSKTPEHLQAVKQNDTKKQENLRGMKHDLNENYGNFSKGHYATVYENL
jgi:hypothetical protein